MDIRKKNLPLILLCAVFLFACAYIVTPEPDVTPTSTATQGWTAIVTNVAPAAGGLRIELAIRNDTGSWSAMQSTPDQPAVLTTAGGKTVDCVTVFVGTGGHRLAPGFQMRGYTTGTKADPQTQLLYVECEGASASPGAKLAIGYSYVTGAYNFYVPSHPTTAKFDLDLDAVVANLQYPLAETVAGLVEKPGLDIEAINKCVLKLTDAKRTDTGLEFTWETTNPGEYPTYVHIGTPPVIGSDGIIYGIYESPHLADAPITPSGGKTDWTTDVSVPKDVTGLYILVSVETKQQRMFFSHAIDITDK
ncbi:MAG TPA: hypothetical protein VMC09_17605 [Anaerolineales bacterium]|nr:hypothetical protein [Anaerolineales bacterium]